MSSFITYFIQTVIAVSVFYILYWFLLRKETFFRFNRYYFLVSMVIALFIPVLDVGNLLVFKASTPVQTISGGYVYLQNAILNNMVVYQNEIIEKPGFMEYMAGIYFIGAAFLVFRLVFQTVLLLLRIRRARIIKMLGSWIVLDEKVSSPFSFFSWIFLNPSQIGGRNISDIILHEKEHIKQKHSYDLYLIELISAFQWVNPFVWLFRKSAKETHEYLADNAVLEQGITVSDYKKLLLSYTMGVGHPALITPLNYSLNKKRMVMMTKMKSPNSRKWRSLLLFPIVLFLSLAFSNPFSGGSPFEDQKGSTESHLVKGKVTAEDTNKPLPGTSVIIKDTNTGTITDKNGEFVLEIEEENIMLSVSFIGYETLVVQAKKDEFLNIVLKRKTDKKELDYPEKKSVVQLSSIHAGLNIIDGKEVTKEEAVKLQQDPENIQSISVLKGETAVEKYGEKGKNGVMIFTTKDYISVNSPGNLNSKENIKLSSLYQDRVPLFFVNEKEITNEKFSQMNPENIESLTVLKGESAVKKYGERARDGVIIITLKDYFSTNSNKKCLVKGKVLDDSTGEPLSGAIIILLNTTIGTITDHNGEFSLQVDKEKAWLAISYVGYKTFIVEAKDGEYLDLKLKRGVTNSTTILPDR